MSEIKNGRLGLYGAEYSKSNRMMTLGSKGLTWQYVGRLAKTVHVLVMIDDVNVKERCSTYSPEIGYHFTTQHRLELNDTSLHRVS